MSAGTGAPLRLARAAGTADEPVDIQILLRVDVTLEQFREKPPGFRLKQITHWQIFVGEAHRGAAIEYHTDRACEPPVAKVNLCCSTEHRHLVEVVVQNGPEVVKRITRVRNRKILCQCVGNGIGMTDTFPFHNFRFQFAKLQDGHDVQVLHFLLLLSVL